ncbi:MAG: sialidase family protein [Planctomycetota bacterium]
MMRYEDSVELFVGESKMQVQELFSDERFPNVVVSTEGTVIATWGKNTFRLRRSEDGGDTWGPEIEVADPGFHGGGATVDEANETVIVFAEKEHPPKTPRTEMGPLKVFRSADDGTTWERVEAVIHPDPNGFVPSRHMAEHGIALRHGEHAGRLIRPARVYNKAGAEPARYCCAIYSDDGGDEWFSSEPFPEPGTGESALIELSDGRIYCTARKSDFDTQPDDYHFHRPVAWSHDGGKTWEGLELEKTLPDGPRYRSEKASNACYNGHFGLFAGLTRLPVEGRDVLLYSNADTPGDERIRGTVWASFDGGDTWPIKRLVHDGPFAYSSLNAGRPGTPSEGWIYLQFEGGENHCYDGGLIARFNLSWLLEGEATGEGELPEWVR